MQKTRSNNTDMDECHIRKAVASELSPQEIDALTRATIDGFGSAMTREDTIRHITSGKILYVFESPNSSLVGFASFNLYGIRDGVMEDTFNVTERIANVRRILYVNGMVVEKEYQKKGLLSKALETVIRDTEPTHIVLRTQSPVPYHILGKLGMTYPSLEAPTEDVVEIGSMIAAKLGMERYEPNEFVERGTYGKSLYGEEINGDRNTNRLFREKLKLDRLQGDSVIVVTKLEQNTDSVEIDDKKHLLRAV